MTSTHIRALAVGVLLLWGGAVWSAQGQEAGAKAEQSAPRDAYQRSLKIYEFNKAAVSGPARGEEIYYYKCWYCHNEYTTGAPRLDGMQKRGRLLSGSPVDQKSVTEKILKGGPKMPAYRASMTDADVKDLVDFLLGGKCCFDSNNPPANPDYRARPQGGKASQR